MQSTTRPLEELHTEFRLRCTLHPQKAFRLDSEEHALDLVLRHALPALSKGKRAVVLEGREDVVRVVIEALVGAAGGVFVLLDEEEAAEATRALIRSTTDVYSRSTVTLGAPNPRPQS
ncbi:hypothetical protein CVT25_009264 [Psilocybe cyanescens]|uniref:Uncharacterized protein n=1 Tax=Psilocybe cyanescens TaxID=93625 RepID=A0A409XTH3_PSICY|nr:hypothetical protein CVT25_009264 [Psilocybe cyanescens]